MILLKNLFYVDVEFHLGDEIKHLGDVNRHQNRCMIYFYFITKFDVYYENKSLFA
jgi:hypothetical protein